MLEGWRAIHNAIIPTHPLSADDVAERATRHRLTVARAGGALVGNATLRPPRSPDQVATVIVRILPAYRRNGHGTEYLQAELARARADGAERIETVVLVSHEAGLAFAHRHGFVEHDRYLLDGDLVPYADLHLPAGADTGADGGADSEAGLSR
ncbi:GNAT family N-acetyltransferase [Nocardioides sp. GY 10113]|nr:GNAT family N-acetyltransferase [Nocardioides sp. GY 10113]TIC82517.1 GNAT family N-acetyltransferase [Nocardioides sp. GY 10113]